MRGQQLQGQGLRVTGEGPTGAEPGQRVTGEEPAGAGPQAASYR